MKLGITGLSGSGKSTVFSALTKENTDAHKIESKIGTINVPDERVDFLSNMYKPKKTTYAQVKYFLPGVSDKKEKEAAMDQNIWNQVRDCDALINVIRNFNIYGVNAPTPLDDFLKLNQDLILTDLIVIEKRIERLELDQKRGKKAEPELSSLYECKKLLEKDIPLRKNPELVNIPAFKGFAFLSAKPMLVLFNNEDENENLPEVGDLISQELCMIIRGKLEKELAQMGLEEAQEFLKEFNIASSAMDRVIKNSYELLGLISFFTVGDDEVKAWTIKKETIALDAAEVIHSDIKKGFIRAEVLSYKNLIEAGTYNEARKKGSVRLEGKTYNVEDGDIINFRFNV